MFRVVIRLLAILWLIALPPAVAGAEPAGMAGEGRMFHSADDVSAMAPSCGDTVLCALACFGTVTVPAAGGPVALLDAVAAPYPVPGDVRVAGGGPDLSDRPPKLFPA